MRTALLTLTTFVLTPFAAPAADPGADAARERTVRVALALAATECGKCRTDLPAARDEARKSGKPLVIFVATDKCEATAAIAAGGIPVRVPAYGNDGQAPTAPRTVVVAAAAGELRIAATLPADAAPAVVRAATLAARPALDWLAGPK